MSRQFTTEAEKALNKAAKFAIRMGQRIVGSEHLLFGLSAAPGVAAKVLKENGMDKERLDIEVREYCGMSDVVEMEPLRGETSPKLEELLLAAAEEAGKMQLKETGTEHMLLAILKDTSCVAYKILLASGAPIQKLYTDIILTTGGDMVQAKNELIASRSRNKKNSGTPTLDQYARDLTQYAKDGKLDPVLNRDDEIESVIGILSRRMKNNPCLIGEPGVGKTAIVEGLASRIVDGAVPDTLEQKRILTLDLSGMVAGSKYRGEFEERIKRALRETKAAGNILLFIDELHTVIGAGGAEGAIDASNILKPAMARGEIQVIGATTREEYRKHIEKDAALERRFQPVLVDEPTVEDAISILRGLKERYEVFHGVKIQDQALIAAATLSDRYITDRFLPDKAIDLIDEACALIRTEMNSMPTEMDEIQRKIMQHEIEEAALKKEDDKLSQAHLQEVQQELAQMREQFHAMKAKWENEKANISKVQKLREELESVNAQIAKAEREYDLNKAAELKYGKLPSLKKELEAEEAKAEAAKEQSDNLLRDKVTEEEIARIICRWTGIPVARLMEGEREKLLHMEDILHRRVIGQDEAVEKVSDAILRSRAGIQDPNRPLGSFLFLGPTGVGKTELAKALAEALFDDENNIVRIDMSEYMEKFSVSRLIGAPPGYVGYEEGGQLTEAVRRKPYSVVLLDEIEKAHPDVFNILLQVLDDGRITDSQGRTVDFKNTIIILTSNLGSPYILDGINADGEISEEARQKVDQLLKQSFRPEFLNRLDEIVFYKPLMKTEIYKIVDLMLNSLRKRLEDKQLSLTVTDAAKDYIIANGYDVNYGARPLKRWIQQKVETLLARKIIAEDLAPNTMLTVDYDGNKLIVR